jgi:hypothetical protein
VLKEDGQLSVAAMSWAWKQVLPAIDKYVLVALSDHANDEDFTCWPSLTHLQRKTGLSRPTIWKTIDRLEKYNAVIRLGVHASGSTIYRVSIGNEITYVGKDVTLGKELTLGNVGNEVGNVGTQLGNVGNKVGNDVTPNHKNHHESSGITIGASAPSVYPIEFEDVWKLYPPREGGSSKKKAFRSWNARRKEGFSAEVIRQAVERYGHFCKLKNQLHTSYVKQAVTFFNDADNLTNAWTVNIGATNGTHQRTDNTAPGRVQSRIDARKRQRSAIDAESERID